MKGRAVKIKGSWNCGRSLEITEKDVPIQVLESGRCSGSSAKSELLSGLDARGGESRREPSRAVNLNEAVSAGRGLEVQPTNPTWGVPSYFDLSWMIEVLSGS